MIVPGWMTRVRTWLALSSPSSQVMTSRPPFCHALVALREGDYLRWAGAAVEGERIVLQRVRVSAAEAGPRHAVHIGPPVDPGRGQLGAQPSGGERMPCVVGDPPCASRCERQVVGEAGVRHAVVVGRDGVPRGELGGVCALDCLAVAPVLHDDHEDVWCVRLCCGRWSWSRWRRWCGLACRSRTGKVGGREWPAG